MASASAAAGGRHIETRYTDLTDGRAAGRRRSGLTLRTARAAQSLPEAGPRAGHCPAATCSSRSTTCAAGKLHAQGRRTQQRAILQKELLTWKGMA